MRKLSIQEVPRAALNKMSARQRSYLDEFSFFQDVNGLIHAHYANELLAIWDGNGWASNHHDMKKLLQGT